MGNATSFFNLMCNIGASIGIPSVTTTVARHSQTHINILSGHITPNDPAALARMNSIKNRMTVAGMDAVSAAHQMYGTMFGMVQRQAAMLSYIDVFRLLAAMSIIVLPLIFIMKKPEGASGPESMGH